MGENRVNYYASVIICVLGVLFSAYVAFRYLFLGVLPFLLSWGIAFFIRPLTEHLHKRIKLPKKILNFSIVLISLLLLLCVLFIISDRLVSEIRGLILHASENPTVISDTLDRINELVSSFSEKLDIFGIGKHGEVGEYLSSLAEKSASDVVTYLPKLLGKIVMTLPKITVFIIVSVIAAFYFSTDLQKINEGFLSLFPERWKVRIVKIKDILFDSTLKYLRSYLIIMAITFFLLLLGFLIIGVRYFFVLSVIFAVADILPVVGVGAFLIPWGIFSLATGELYRGMGLIILYALITVTRQVIEPKIIGVSLGIHPLYTLFSMYLGLTLFGVGGMILGPIFALILKSIFASVSNKNNLSDVRKRTVTKTD